MSIESFLNYLQYEKVYSSHTVLSYSNDIGQFAQFLDARAEPDWTIVGSDDVRQWVVALMDSGEKPSSVARKLSAVKSFFKYLLRQVVVAVNPAVGVSAPKRPKPLPIYFEERQMELQAEHDPFEGESPFESERNDLIIEMLYQTGMRRAELLALSDSDVDASRKVLRVFGKRRKERSIPIGDGLIEAVERYQAHRNEVVPRQDDSLFVRENGLPLYPKAVYLIVTRRMGAVSTLAKHSPHVLRHTFATTMLNHGAELNAVKELLGHSSLASTQVYTHTTFEELQKIYKNAHPREDNDK